jgi:hypothetical protein
MRIVCLLGYLKALMPEDVSARLVAQRIRNRIMELMRGLEEGESYLRTIGVDEWINRFFDWMPLNDEEPLSNSAMTEAERQAVSSVRELMIQAAQESNGFSGDWHEQSERLIASGWVWRAQQAGHNTLTLMLSRGYYSEDLEESEPSPDSKRRAEKRSAFR